MLLRPLRNYDGPRWALPKGCLSTGVTIDEHGVWVHFAGMGAVAFPLATVEQRPDLFAWVNPPDEFEGLPLLAAQPGD